MTDQSSKANSRLTKISDFLTGNKTATAIPWDPDCTKFPSRKDVPRREDAPEGAAWVWGKNDYIGRINLLTPTRVAAASKEIRTGEIVPLNLPLNIPTVPAFLRETFQHEIKPLDTHGTAFDDKYALNTQSGTQWDGFRHFAHTPTETFYNFTKGSDILGPEANDKCSIHHWSKHGFAGRGVLLDYRSYATSKGIQYESASTHSISYDDLVEVGKFQGIDIRPAAQGGDIKIGDILFVRAGFAEDYYKRSPEENAKIGLRTHGGTGENVQRWAGVKQSQQMIDWLHDCYFAAVAGDAPTFECWPTQESYHLHEYILALWGMPLGEMLDLEKMSELAKKNKKWTFFFCSSPANVPNGVSSHVNGTAIF